MMNIPRHALEANMVFPVCGNSLPMLAESRLAPHIHFIGDFSSHNSLIEGCGA